MAVELKITKNANKFRQPAITFQKHGMYTFAPPGTTEYLKYWTQEAEYCMSGYTAEDGDRISGYYYFYLNYFPINLVKEIEIEDARGNKTMRSIKDRDFPRFYDYDRFFFDAIEEAEHVGRHMTVLKARRKGFSYKVASMLDRNFYFYRESKGFALASEMEFLTKDGILTKAWDGMDFIDQHTAWFKKRQKMNQKMHKRASFVQKDRTGVEIELGYKSEIIGVTLKNEPDRARGKAGKLIIFEEAGLFPNLLKAWQIAKPSVEQGSQVFGMLLAFGTGGVEGADFESLKELFERPSAYGCLEFDNIWDEDAVGTKCGFFVPQYANLEGHYNNPGDPDHGKPFMDEDGNTDVRIAKRFIMEERQKVIDNASDKRAIDRHIAEQPCFPGDTLISTDKGICRIEEHEDAWITGSKLTYEVTTSDGTKFRATSNHELFDGKEYRPLSSYKIGDKIKYKETVFSEEYQYVDIKGKIPALDFKLKIDEDWATFLGLYMGDGSYYAKGGDLQIVFDVKDIESYKWYENFANKYLGKAYVKDYRPNKNMISVNVYNKDAQSVYKQLGMLKQVKDYTHKRKVNIPDYIMKSPKSVVASFLKGLFDSDGHSCNSGTSIGVGLKHYEVLEKVQFLLRGFGIHSKLSSREQVNGNGYVYTDNKVSIRSIDVEKFINQIGFISSRKNGNIKPRADRLSNRDYTFGTIIKIEEYSVEQVWDVTTKDHTLSANGIFAHNCTPSEACLNISTNIFPKADLQRHLSYIRTHEKVRNFKQVGDLYFDNDGKVKWKQAPKGEQKDIIKYKLDKNDDPTGQIVIWEHPMDNPPYGMYIAGTDPYDFDKSGTNSLGSTFIYKRFQTFEGNYETIVAEYTGRPDTANEYYENVRKLLLYFNATLLYENEKKGLFFYFERKHCTYLLADQPGDLLRDIVKDSSVDRKKGIHMNQPIKDWGEGAIRDWLIEEYEPGIKNLTKIYSEALLEELISYNDTGNFDRCVIENTLISTDKGYIPIQDININDKVLTHTGEYQRVVWKDKSTRVNSLITVDLVGNNEQLVVTDNHPLLLATVKTKKHSTRIKALDNISWTTAKDILENKNKYNFLLHPKRSNLGITQYEDDFLYLVGWILADGSIEKGQLKICLGPDQEEIADKICVIIDKYTAGYAYNKRPVNKARKRIIKTNTGGHILVTKSCKPFAELLQNLGCINNNKHINFKLYNSYGLIPLVIGYLEGDGHQKKYNKYDGYLRSTIECSSKYKTLIKQIRQILIDHGIWSSISTKSARNNGKEQYCISISGKYVDRLLDWYPSIKFSKLSYSKIYDKNIQLETDYGFWIPIKSIKYSDRTDKYVYNIEVENDNSYVASNCVNHNCMAMMMVMLYKQQLHHVHVKQKKELARKNLLFPEPVFAGEIMERRTFI